MGTLIFPQTGLTRPAFISQPIIGIFGQV